MKTKKMAGVFTFAAFLACVLVTGCMSAARPFSGATNLDAVEAAYAKSSAGTLFSTSFLDGGEKTFNLNRAMPQVTVKDGVAVFTGEKPPALLTRWEKIAPGTIAYVRFKVRTSDAVTLCFEQGDFDTDPYFGLFARTNGENLAYYIRGKADMVDAAWKQTQAASGLPNEFLGAIEFSRDGKLTMRVFDAKGHMSLLESPVTPSTKKSTFTLRVRSGSILLEKYKELMLP